MRRNSDVSGGEGLNLDALYSDREAPTDLENRVVSDLIAEGLLERRRRPWVKWPLRLAAGLVLFGAGWGLGLRQEASPVSTGSRFMLLLWEGPDFGAGAPVGAVADEYAEWAASAGRRGISLSGNELGPERATIAPNGGGPVPPQDLTLGGYFLLEAESPEAARLLAEGHPHLRNGGWVELAPIVSR